MKVILSYHFSFFSITMAGPGMLSFIRTEKYCAKLADEVMELRGEKCLMDFKIHVKDDEFPCAKFVMAAHSPMLRAMLTSDMAEVAKQEIRLDHIRKDIIQIILDFMYCEDVSFHKDQLMDLLAASDYLQMAELKEMCLDEVPDILEPGNVIEWWKEATKMNYDTITKPCEMIMAANFKHIAQQTDFLNLDLKDIQYYVSDICGETGLNNDIVDAVIRWTANKEERVALLEDLLSKIQLNKCTDEGLEGIMKTHESLLDKTPMVYKLLFKTLSGIRADTSKIMSDTVVIVGGQDGNKVNQVCWKVDQSDEIVQLCDIPSSDLGEKCSVCEIPQGFVMTGGTGSLICMMFTISTKLWVRLQNLLDERHGHGSICVKEVLYVLGGYLGKYTEGKQMSDSVHLMKMKKGEWNNGPIMPLAVKFPKLSNLGDNVYLLDEITNQLLRFDTNEKVWSQLASLSEEKTYCVGVSMASARGQLFVSGGGNRICAWYQPETNTWCTGKQPLQKHRYGALACHNNKLLLLGGSFNDGTDEVEEYDIAEDKWTVCSYKLPRKLYNHHAFTMAMS